MSGSRVLVGVAMIVGCFGGAANAQTIIQPTYLCGLAAAKAGAKFSDKVADAIEGCLLSVMKCNLKFSPADQACVDQLLAPGGRCAAGKLAPAGAYFGDGSLVNIDSSSIGKAYGAYRAQMSKCDPIWPIDYTSLNFPITNPSGLVQVLESLNDDDDGPACVAHKRVLSTIPSRDALVQQLQSSVNAANLPSALAGFLDPLATCK